MLQSVLAASVVPVSRSKGPHHADLGGIVRLRAHPPRPAVISICIGSQPTQVFKYYFISGSSAKGEI